MSYVPATFGSSLVNQLSVAAGKNCAAIVDTTKITAAELQCSIVAGATAPTTPTTFSLYRLPAQLNGSTPYTTLSSGVSASATSLSVASATYIPAKCTILLVSASTGLGELVTVTAVSGTTLTVTAITNAYSSGAYVFLMEQTPSGGAIQVGLNVIATQQAGTSFAVPPVAPGVGFLWAIVAVNGDATYAVTVTVNMDYCQ